MGSVDGRLRLAVDVAGWNPPPSEFDFLCGAIPDEEASECRKFRFLDDQKRALAGRLLQRHAAAKVLGIEHEEIIIKRTKGRKPFVANQVSKPHAPNFNYSISHEGDYVIFASEPLCVVGCDVAAPRQMRRSKSQSLSEVLAAYKKQLTASEWSAVHGNVELSELSEAEIELNFLRFWSLKEAYVKATGEGLGFELGRCEFRINGDKRKASVAVDGVSRPDWIFHLHELGRGHWVSVARGPVSAIVDAWGGFRATLHKGQVSADDHLSALEEPEPPFTLLHISDLLPPRLHGAYEDAGGDIL